MIQRRRRGPKGRILWERCEMIDIRKGDVFRVRSGAPICCAREDARYKDFKGKMVPSVPTLSAFLRPGDYD